MRGPLPSCEISSLWRLGRFHLGRRGWEAWEGWILLTLPSGSWQVSGPNPMFTDSQEIQEIRVTFVTALSYLVAKESPPSLTPPLFLSWRLPGDTGLRSVPEKEVVTTARQCPGQGLCLAEVCRHLRTGAMGPWGQGAGLIRYWVYLGCCFHIRTNP